MNNELELIYIFIKQAKESMNIAFNELLKQVEDSKYQEEKRYVENLVYTTYRFKLSKISTTVRTIFIFLKSTISALIKATRLKNKDFEVVRKRLQEAENKMKVRLNKIGVKYERTN